MSGTIGRVVLGVVSDRYLGGRRKGLLSLVEIVGGSLGILLALVHPGTSVWILGLLIFWLGFTAVGWNGLFLTIAAEIVGEEHTALATGLAASVTFLGISLLPPAFGYIVDFTGSYRVGWFSIGAVAILGALLVAAIPLKEGVDAGE